MKTLIPTKVLCTFFCLAFAWQAIAQSSPAITGASTSCVNSGEYYNVANGGTVESWSVTGTNTISITGNTAQVLWLQAGVFTVTAVVRTNATTTVTLNYQVTVYTLPLPSVISLNSNLCTTLLTSSKGRKSGEGTTAGTSAQSGDVRSLDRKEDDQTCYTVCESGWYRFSADGAAGSSYTWQTDGNGVIVPLNANGDSVRVRWTAVGYATLTVHETDVNGCIGSTSICIQVINSPTACLTSAPAADAGGVINVCLNSTLSLNSACSQGAYGADIASRKWILGDGTVIGNSPFVNHSYSQPGTYTVMLVVESNCSCADTIYRTVVVDSSQGPDIYCVNSVCHDSISTFTTSDPCTNLLWSVTGGTLVPGSSVTNDSITVQWGDGNAGYGTVSLLSSCSGACPFPTQVYVPILPDSAIINGDSVVCNFATETYSVPFVPTTIYTWYLCQGPFNSPTCAPMSYGNSNEISHTWATSSALPAHNYSIMVTYSNPFLGCSGFSRMPIIIANGFYVDGDSVICEGGEADLKAKDNTHSPLNCTWHLYSYSTGTTTLVNANATDITLTGLAVGYYTVYTTSVDPYWCGNPVITSLRVVAAPAAPTAAVIGPVEVCPNTLVSYFTAAAPSGYYLQWTATEGTPATGVGQDFNTSWGNTLPAQLDVKYVMVSAPGCSSSVASTTITQIPLTFPAITGTNSTCGDERLSYQIVGVAEDYVWSVDPATAGSVALGQHTNTVQVQWNQYTASVTATAHVNLTIIKCGSTVTRSFDVTLHPTPVANLTASAGPYCVNSDITFTATPASQAAPPAYHWDFGDGTTANNSDASPEHQFTQPGTYPVTVTIDEPNGCVNPVSASVTVDVLPGPAAVLSANGPTNHCDPPWSSVLTVTLQNMTGTTFTYQLFDNSTPIGSPGSSNTFTVTTAGSYRVKVVNSSNCEAFTNYVYVTENCTPGTGCTPIGSVSLSLNSQNCGVVSVTATPSSGVTVNNIFFEDPEGNETVNASTASHTYITAGSYRVIVNATAPATGGGTCSVSDELWVVVGYVPAFNVQYACSANGPLQVHPIDLSTYYTSANAITSWQWYVDGNTAFSYYTQAPAITVTPPGAHTLTLIIDNTPLAACTLTHNINVPVPVQASYTSNGPVCETDAMLFTSTSSPSGAIVSYLWEYGDGTSSSLQNSARVFDDAPASGGLTYTSDVTLTVVDAYGCQSQVTHQQTINENFIANAFIDFTPSTITSCIGATVNAEVTINLLGINATPYTYLWSNGATADNIDITASGNYSVTITDANLCRRVVSAINAYFQSINPVLQGDTFFCKDEVMNLSIFKGHQYTYSWLEQRPGYPVGPASPVPGTPYLIDREMNSNSNGHTFWGVVSLAGCTATTQPLTVYQYNYVAIDDTAIVSPLTLCANEAPITITILTDPPAGILWSNGTYGPTIVLSTPGIYEYTLIDTNGCRNDGDGAIPILWGPDFDQLISGCYTRCIGDNNTLYGPSAPIGETYTYQWIKVEPNGTIAVVSTQKNYTPTVSGVYRLIISDVFGNAPFACVDTSNEIYLELLPCPDTWCIPDGMDTSCVGCHFDPDSNARVMEFLVSFNYTGTTSSPYSLHCSTANINAYENIIPASGLTPAVHLGHTVQPGPNYIHMEIWDTPPHSSTHQIMIVIGNCHIPVNIQTPAQCE